MKTKSIFTQFLKYASLNVLGMVGISCYILADTFFVAQGLGADGLAALNLAIPVYSFINGTGLMLGMGGAIRFSIQQGQGKDANMTFMNSLYLAVGFALIYIIMGFFGSEQIAVLLGAEGEILSMTATYLKVILLFSPAFLLNNILLAFVRNDSAPRLSMTAMIFGSLMNILLDYLFIFPCGMGIFGAAFATGLAPLFSMAVLSFHWLKKRNSFAMKKEGFTLTTAVPILFLGIPSLITELSSGIVIVIYNLILLKLEGNIGVAAYGVIANLSLVVIAIFTGIGQGMQPLISRAYGRGEHMVCTKILRYGMFTTVFLAVAIYIFLFFGAGPVTAAFNSEGNPQLQQIAQLGLRLYFTGIPFAGINILFCSYFASSEKPVPAQAISLMRGLLIIVPLAFLMSFWMGVDGVWLSFLTSEFIVALFGTGAYRRLKNRTLQQDHF
jgi:putative MATE family efflux protein